MESPTETPAETPVPPEEEPKESPAETPKTGLRTDGLKDGDPSGLSELGHWTLGRTKETAVSRQVSAQGSGQPLDVSTGEESALRSHRRLGVSNEESDQARSQQS